MIEIVKKQFVYIIATLVLLLAACSKGDAIGTTEEESEKPVSNETEVQPTEDEEEPEEVIEEVLRKS